MDQIIGYSLQILNVAFVGGIFFKLGGFNVDIQEIKRRLNSLEKEKGIFTHAKHHRNHF